MTPVDQSSELLSHQELLGRVAGDTQLLAEMVQLFQSEHPQWLNDVRLAIQGNDAPRLAATAHTLKGAVGNFSSGPAYQLSLQLEGMGKERNLSGAPAALAELEVALQRMSRALNCLIEETP
jgi:HPt (histidine-containing phosphotransfer) domain-containing protein